MDLHADGRVGCATILREPQAAHLSTHTTLLGTLHFSSIAPSLLHIATMSHSAPPRAPRTERAPLGCPYCSGEVHIFRSNTYLLVTHLGQPGETPPNGCRFRDQASLIHSQPYHLLVTPNVACHDVIPLTQNVTTCSESENHSRIVTITILHHVTKLVRFHKVLNHIACCDDITSQRRYAVTLRCIAITGACKFLFDNLKGRQWSSYRDFMVTSHVRQGGWWNFYLVYTRREPPS